MLSEQIKGSIISVEHHLLLEICNLLEKIAERETALQLGQAKILEELQQQRVQKIVKENKPKEVKKNESKRNNRKI